MNKIYTGDALAVLKTLPTQSVHTCITSPPYYGLRDYGVAGQIGLEETPEAYIGKLVAVFREVRRVLRDDGTLWLNLGDTYSSQRWSGSGKGQPINKNRDGFRDMNPVRITGLPEKNLIGIPWRVAFALQADGWYLRQDFIWHKPNPMPESVTDRCTKVHEYLFLLSKSQNYYFDHEAIREPSVHRRKVPRGGKGNNRHKTPDPNDWSSANGWKPASSAEERRNRRSVWIVTTKRYNGAHFATFPTDLIEPCILAGAPTGGVVLDPFLGSGTTAAVAAKHGRRHLGIELNPTYVEVARRQFSRMQRL